MERTNAWIAKLLQEKGTDIFRMKGVLAMAGCEDKYVYQGVHMLFTGEARRRRRRRRHRRRRHAPCPRLHAQGHALPCGACAGA